MASPDNGAICTAGCLPLRMRDTIHHFIKSHAALDPAGMLLVDAALEYKQVARKTFLLKEGDICRMEAYIHKGCVRTYYIDEKGAEVTLQLAVEDWWVSDIASFNEQVPSRMFMETLEDTELLILTPESKEQLLRQLPQLERMFRIMVQRNLSRLQERFFQAVATTAEERYLDFLQRYPALPQRVAQHYIASFLGMSPEFLSKVRKRLAQK